MGRAAEVMDLHRPNELMENCPVAQVNDLSRS